jgi:hypothetical protein
VSDVNNYGSYNYVITLANSGATKYNVYTSLIGLCDNYDIVDIYFIGHGFHSSTGFYGYCCYDGINSSGVINPYGLFYAPELKSYYIYNADFSTLRLGVGSFFFFLAFKDYFLDEGAVWIGSKIDSSTGEPREVISNYATAYIGSWGYYWYQQNVGSYTAHSYADNAGNIGSGYSYGSNPEGFNYYVKGSGTLSVYS